MVTRQWMTPHEANREVPAFPTWDSHRIKRRNDLCLTAARIGNQRVGRRDGHLLGQSNNRSDWGANNHQFSVLNSPFQIRGGAIDGAP